MKFKSILRKIFFVAFIVGGFSCSQTQESSYIDNKDNIDFKKSATDAAHIVQKKFDRTKILANNLTEQVTSADTIKKILDITTKLLEIEIPHALRALNQVKAHGVELRELNKNILLIKKEILTVQKTAMRRAQDEAKNASLIAQSEKEKVQRVEEELKNAIINTNFLQTNMPEAGAALAARDAAHAACLKTHAFFRALEKFPTKKAYVKSETYVARAKSSATDADNFAKSAQDKYQNVLQNNKILAHQDSILKAKNAANKALQDAEAAELGAQDIFITMSLSLRLKNISAIALTIEKSVHKINLAHGSIKYAEDAIKAAAFAGVTYTWDSSLAKAHEAFESHVGSAGDALLKIAQDKFEEIKNSGADASAAKTAQIDLEVAVDNLSLSKKHLKIFRESLVDNLQGAYAAMKENLTNAKKYKSRARKAIQGLGSIKGS